MFIEVGQCVSVIPVWKIVAESLLSCEFFLFFDVVGHIEDVATLFDLIRCLLMEEINFGTTLFLAESENGAQFRNSRYSKKHFSGLQVIYLCSW